MAKTFKQKGPSLGKKIGDVLGAAATGYMGYKMGQKEGLWADQLPPVDPENPEGPPRSAFQPEAPTQPLSTRAPEKMESGMISHRGTREGTAASMKVAGGKTAAPVVSAPPTVTAASDPDVRLARRVAGTQALSETASKPAFFAGAVNQRAASVPDDADQIVNNVFGFADGGCVRSSRSFPKKGK